MENETQKRTIVKIVIWQTIAIIITICILIIFTNDITNSFIWGLTDHGICMTIHYFYDRGWNKIKWGLESTNNNSSRLVVSII